MRILLVVAFALSLAACQPASEDPAASSHPADPKARAILDDAIAAHGGDVLDDAIVRFNFRGVDFTATRENGQFVYERTYTNDAGRAVRDVLTNDDLFREVEGTRVRLSASEAASLETAVNSVVYFALLPYFLGDAAVQPRYLGEATVQGEPYHEIEVTFRQEGGGRDWQDRFVYWIHRDRHTMDYLAYEYATSGGGSRFREAFNVRTVGGVRFADYHNLAPVPDTLGRPIETYDTMFERGDLRTFSQIILDSVRVEPR